MLQRLVLKALRFIAFALLAAACGGAPAARSPGSAPRAGDPALALRLERARVELELPGAAALIIEDGEVRARAVVGFRSLPSRTPLTLDDRFHLGSDGKAMTATLAAALIEDGSLPPWDTPLSVVFADEEIHPGFRDATLADLAAHRAGFPRDPEVDDEERAAIEAVTDPIAQRQLIVARELRRPPVGPRGEKLYSNVGFVLLGRAIERAAGAPYEEVMRTRLFAPLEMRSCGFEVPEGEGAYGHRVDRTLADSSTMIPPAYAPVGGVHCTMEDWARFVIDHIRGEQGRGTLLSAESYRALHTPPEGAEYAFGWNITTTPRGRLLGHAGSNGFWMAVIRVELDTGRAVLFATNVGEVDLERVESLVHELGSIPMG